MHIHLLKLPEVFRSQVASTGGGGGFSLIWAIWGRAAGQGMVFGLAVLNRVWYYEPRDFNPDCEQSLFFLSLRTGACEKLIYIMKLICIISTE